MDQYQQNLMAEELLDLGFVPHQIPVGGMSYELQDGSLMLSQSIKDESFESGYVGSFERMQHQIDSRSSSCTSTTSQSLSHPLQHPRQDLYALNVNNLPSSTRYEQISPSTTDLSKKESDDECLRTEASLKSAGYTTADTNESTATPGTEPSCSKGLPAEERSQSQAEGA